MYEKKVKVLVCQLRQTLCNSMDCSLPGSSVHGILQSRILEFPLQYSGNWVPISFSPRDLLNPRIEPRSAALQVDSLSSEPQGKCNICIINIFSLCPQFLAQGSSNP